MRHPGELRWETRLLGVVTATLLVFGIATTYGAPSLQTMQGRRRLGFALQPAHRRAARRRARCSASSRASTTTVWRRLAWPLLLVTIVLLLIPLLPFTRSHRARQSTARGAGWTSGRSTSSRRSSRGWPS